jgi:hypothetical protein
MFPSTIKTIRLRPPPIPSLQRPTPTPHRRHHHRTPACSGHGRHPTGSSTHIAEPILSWLRKTPGYSALDARRHYLRASLLSEHLSKHTGCPRRDPYPRVWRRRSSNHKSAAYTVNLLRRQSRATTSSEGSLASRKRIERTWRNMDQSRHRSSFLCTAVPGPH